MCISLANEYNEHKFMTLQYSAVYWSNTKFIKANICNICTWEFPVGKCERNFTRSGSDS